MHCQYTNKTLKLCLPFISWNFYKKLKKKEAHFSYNKNSMIRATNVHQPITFYTNAVRDVRDIYKVCWGTPGTKVMVIIRDWVALLVADPRIMIHTLFSDIGDTYIL